MSKSGVFVFFLGLGMSMVSLTLIGLDPAAAARGVAYLGAFTMTLYGLAGVLTGHFKSAQDA
jgi:hypothetical protein